MKKNIVMPVEKIFLSSKEAMDYLGMSEDFFARLRQDAMLHYYKIGRCIFYLKKDIDELILKNKVI